MIEEQEQLKGLEWARKFRDDAKADGWSVEKSHSQDDIDRECTMRKDGFSMLVYTRDNTEKIKAGMTCRKYEGDISIWGDDGLSIRTPEKYDWDAIVNGKRHCNLCGADDVDTQRYSFAGRCCAKCRPAAAKEYEYPGWYN
jgi:hypothetical protein